MKIVKATPYDRYHFDDVHVNFIDKIFIKPKHQQLTFNRSMFAQDFARIFRYSSKQRDSLFNIESNSDELTQRLFGNIKTGNRAYSIDETVRKLVEEIAQSLIWFGTAYYFLHDSSEDKESYIVPFRGIGVFRFLKEYFQWVPNRCEKYWDSDDKALPRELRILDRTKLMCFNLPKSIRRMLSVQNRTLAVLDKHQYDETTLYSKATHENPNPKNDFNFRVWRDTQERVLYRATQETGWDGRKSDWSKRSTFFLYHRLIRFRRNQLILRDHILGQLGNELTRVGCQYNAEFYVSISPTNVLPQVNELDDLEVKLSREEVNFTEVFDFCYER